jgi:glutamate-1-semialdehyde 2,1-aminomutase
MSESRSKSLFERAKKVIPGGVNSPVRAYKPYPFFTARAQGSRLYDEDGNSYLDYSLAYGPMILGHAHPEINKAVEKQLSDGTMYGTPTEAEVEIAELIASAYPSIDKLRLVNSGTEATMHAIRVARGFTGKKMIVKFEGCYHGAHDYVLVKAGSGATTFGAPDSLGIPEETTRNTLLAPYNDADAIREVVDANEGEVAAVILEPVVGNAGVILPGEGYLNEVRKITEERDILLIADEVITGFRFAMGGAQEYYGFEADITTLGKIMGGGFVIAAYGARDEIMDNVSPLGKIYQAATYAGNPVSVAAGLAALKILARNEGEIYGRLEASRKRLQEGLGDIIEDADIQAQVNGVSSMFQLFFNDAPVVDYKSAMLSDTERFMRYQRGLLERGVYVAPSQFETCFVSAAHSDGDISETLEAMEASIRES